jgi:hypothetical protein
MYIGLYFKASHELACKVQAIPIYRLDKTSVRANYLALPFLSELKSMEERRRGHSLG